MKYAMYVGMAVMNGSDECEQPISIINIGDI